MKYKDFIAMKRRRLIPFKLPHNIYHETLKSIGEDFLILEENSTESKP